MIIYGLAQLILSLLGAVFVVSLPAFPDIVQTGLQTVQAAILSGIGLAAGLLGYDILHAGATFVRLVLLFFTMWALYDAYRWFARKIPMLGLGE